MEMKSEGVSVVSFRNFMTKVKEFTSLADSGWETVNVSGVEIAGNGEEFKRIVDHFERNSEC